MNIQKNSVLKIFVILAAILVANISSAQQVGLTDQGKLMPCPPKPNCKVTEYPDENKNSMAPLLLKEIDTEHKESMLSIKQVLDRMGAEIVTESPDYLHVKFTSFVFSFVDDFEVRIDREARLVHMRSASRTGYYDFGKNKRRIQKFTLLLTGAKER